MNVSRRELLAGLGAFSMNPSLAADSGLRLAWEKNMLTISGENIPGGEVKVWYLEAYCRPGSTDRDWSETVIGLCMCWFATAERALPPMIRSRFLFLFFQPKREAAALG